MQSRERDTQVHGREQGTILLLTLLFALMVGFVAANAVSTALMQSKDSQYSFHRTDSLALAEGTTESAQKRMLIEVANFRPPTLEGVVVIGAGSYPYFIESVGPDIVRTDFDGVYMAIQPYEITSKVDVQSGSATVNRIVDLTMTPLFQFLIFYNDDLEIMPGPDMTLSGRIHSNANVYFGTDHTLTINSDYFRATGQILRERKNNGAETGGTVKVKVFGQDSYVNMSSTMDHNNPDWLNLANETWLGTVQDGSHGVQEIAVPHMSNIKAVDPVTGDKGYYHANADLVIVDDEAFDRDGSSVLLPNGVLSEKTMYDAREGKFITVTEIDIELLNGSGSFPANGLIYAYRTDTTSLQPNGIRLTNGEELLAPLTVVTEDPLFIHGDYNTINKKGSSVIADAVNLLSNAWDDSKTPGTLPGADNTKYNVAMVSGGVPTPDGGGSYSGGFENLPRFHERWSGREAKIRGAFINIYDSDFAVSPWRYGGDVYKAPIRNWEFDEDLQDINNLPPFTPNAVYFRRVLWDDNILLPF